MLLIVIVLVVVFCVWMVYTSPEEKERRAVDEAFVKKYGITEEEMCEKIRTSPNVDKVVTLIVENAYPYEVALWVDRVSLDGKTVLFEDLGFSKIPGWMKHEILFYRTLKSKLPDFYEEIGGHTEDPLYLRRKEEKETKEVIKGW